MELSYGLSYNCLIVVLYVLCNLVVLGEETNAGLVFAIQNVHVHQLQRMKHGTILRARAREAPKSGNPEILGRGSVLQGNLITISSVLANPGKEEIPKTWNESPFDNTIE